MKKKVFIYCLFVFAFIALCSNSLLSQGVRILDSLKNVLKSKTLPDTQRIGTYGIVSNFYIASDIDKCSGACAARLKSIFMQFLLVRVRSIYLKI